MAYILIVLVALCVAPVLVRAPPTECPAPGLTDPTYILAPDDKWSSLQKQYERDLNSRTDFKELKAYLEEKQKRLTLTSEEEKSETLPYPLCLVPPSVCESKTEIINYWKVMNTEEPEVCWLVEALPWVTCTSSPYPAFSCYVPNSEVGFRCLVNYIWQTVNVYCVDSDEGGTGNVKVTGKGKIKPKERFRTMRVRVAYACKSLIYECQIR